MSFMSRPWVAGTVAAILGIAMAYGASQSPGVNPHVTLWGGSALAIAVSFGLAWAFFRKP